MIQNESFHYKRERINKLFTEAMNYPLVIVCAGSGYGKTSAVYDFAEENHGTKIWVQLSERDNVGSRFWENCANTIAPLNETFAREAIRLGFPDTPDKFKQFSTLLRAHIGIRKRILVLDDFHYIQEPSVVRFLEECVLKKMPMETSIFLLSRSSPQINIANLLPKGYIFNIDENDLRFTENELAQYFSQENITLQPESLREIMQDTEGWVFAINLIARSFQKAPGYGGYVRNAVKTNIYKMLETEVWDSVSEDLQRFMIRLSLIEHLSTDLIAQLAGNDHSLITELEKQNAYVRRDNYINAYLIHPLLLDFLSKKEELLSEKQKKETYEIAGKWCNKNGFKLDALFYFEKTGDYNAIASVLYALPAQIPRDIAKYAATILDRAPDEIFNTIENLATMHLSTYICQGLWDKSIGLAEHYEKKFLKLPKNNAFRNISLSAIYYSWGYLRILMCITDDCYDFDIYFEKFCKHFTNTLEQKKFYNHAPGPWVNAAGTSKKGSLDDFIDSLARSSAAISQCFNGIKTGDEDLARGELKFYQGDMPAAETFMIRALEQSREYRQFEVTHRALFYLLRLSIVHGNFSKAEMYLNDIKAQLDENEYIKRDINYDITLCWYYCTVGSPEKTPDWLTDSFAPYGHAAFIENFGNQMKALYCLVTRNYPPLLSYIQEMKLRESYLYGRVEMLALEACVHYRMKNRQQALSSLKEAYDEASPNNLTLPFIELGKDMRTLTSFAAKSPGNKIPKTWLETINRKSASYAKRLAHVISQYKQAHSIGGISISPRETEILTDLSHGLSRTEIATNRNLSINTVKMVINSLYMKLGAKNLADAIRVAAEKKIV